MTSGGSKRELYEFTKRLKRDGNSIYLFTNSEEKNQYLDLTNLVDKVYIFPFNRIQYISFTLPFFKSILNLFISRFNIYKIINVSKKMARVIDKKNCEYVFIHHNKHYVQSPFLIKYLKTKSIYFCAEPQRTIYDRALLSKLRNLEGDKNNILKNLYFNLTNSFDEMCKKSLIKKIEKYDYENINQCNLVLTNSYFSRENILSAYGVDAKVVHLGGDVFGINSKKNKNYKNKQILTMGSINPIKCFDIIIKALGIIKKELRPNLVIIGNSVNKNYLKKLKKLSIEYNVDVNIQINISDSELEFFFKESSLFVYTPYLEPLGLAPLEAMVFGLPVIAVKEGGLRETIIDNYSGFLVDRDVNELSGKVLKILNDQDLFDKMSKNNKNQIIKYWNWNMAYNRFLNAIK